MVSPLKLVPIDTKKVTSLLDILSRDKRSGRGNSGCWRRVGLHVEETNLRLDLEHCLDPLVHQTLPALEVHYVSPVVLLLALLRWLVGRVLSDVDNALEVVCHLAGTLALLQPTAERNVPPRVPFFLPPVVLLLA